MFGYQTLDNTYNNNNEEATKEGGNLPPVPEIKNWSRSKQGEKKSVYWFQMKGENYYEYSIILDLNSLYLINQIVIGFNEFASDGGDKLLITPSVVIIEGGPTQYQLQNLGIINRPFNDSGYSFSAVKVFALNLADRQIRNQEK